MPSHRTIGSLCSGYGGLDLAAETVYDAHVTWHAETDPHASRILARHWPGVPNLGDITTVDWTTVPKVCVLTAGFPCQRHFRRRPPRRPRPRHPLRPLAPRRPRHRGPPTLPGGDRKRPRHPHLTRPPPSRPGTLPVVSGKHPRPASSARTRRRTRLPGRPPVRREMARPTRLRRRSTPPPRTPLPHRHSSKPPPATSAPTAAPNTPTNAEREATAPTSRTRWSGSCRHRRPRTARRAAPDSATAPGT
ncbi:DNA cytosine methyltransferase [Streptomyces acidiscabies]|uniref:DNA cytosine methyltransferase n=1 Tax=Streptomyces acidiscabies TaxID=42234 RepID=A0AAP6ELQ8_9ACTN|nr:DNA cytosine methyltransferase [Streptomyces acidiscabies]MBZ3915292.1 DNA cytosine methyltransferase [Streptomyces acidiscabies]MDX2967263.1 DNA cytosine methyltransferase [Streptomyces acidiscabies]MDX3026065.1 DNA cytosine methyltransferase [Streptomyces acidiscabies]MDX3797040.1 DNA cytosine methyltransferase [Streptomyces acidiscabies]GAQ58962.1 C-5 cytosine-specific DNA methylase [Streptomyces acidiscabies]